MDQPPVVRSLADLYNSQSAVYDPQVKAAQDQIAQTQQAGTAQIAGLDVAKTNAFNGIDQTAASRGALFSGFSPDAQASYVGEKYLPALANVQATNNQAVQGLNSTITGLRADQQKQAQTLQEGDLNKLYDYQKTQSDRQFQTQQAQQAYEQELQKLRLSASLSASSAASSTPSTAQFLVSAFSGYDPTKGNGYTEKEVIPALMANYGITKTAAANLAYSYRKQNYGE